MQVVGQVGKGLQALHASGYAHCNLKPSNIMRRPKKHDWVLSDFCDCSPAGAPPHKIPPLRRRTHACIHPVVAHLKYLPIFPTWTYGEVL